MIFYFLTALFYIVSLTSCGEKSKPASQSEKVPTTEDAPTTETTTETSTQEKELNKDIARNHAAVIYDFILTLIEQNPSLKNGIGSDTIIDIPCKTGSASVSLINRNLTDNFGLFNLKNCSISSDEMKAELNGDIAVKFLITGFPELYADMIAYRGKTNRSAQIAEDVEGNCAINLQPFAIFARGNICEFQLADGAADSTNGQTYSELSAWIKARELKPGRDFPSLLDIEDTSIFTGICANSTRTKWLFLSAKEAQKLTDHFNSTDCSDPAVWAERVLYKIAVREKTQTRIAIEMVSDRRNVERYLDSELTSLNEVMSNDKCHTNGYISYCERTPIREFRLFGPDPVGDTLEMGEPGLTEKERPEDPSSFKTYTRHVVN